MARSDRYGSLPAAERSAGRTWRASTGAPSMQLGSTACSQRSGTRTLATDGTSLLRAGCRRSIATAFWLPTDHSVCKTLLTDQSVCETLVVGRCLSRVWARMNQRLSDAPVGSCQLPASSRQALGGNAGQLPRNGNCWVQDPELSMSLASGGRAFPPTPPSADSGTATSPSLLPLPITRSQSSP